MNDKKLLIIALAIGFITLPLYVFYFQEVQQNTQITPGEIAITPSTLLDTSDEFNKPFISTQFETYSDHGLSFEYSADWQMVDEPSDMPTIDNKKIWNFTQPLDGRDTVLSIGMIKNYVSNSGNIDALNSYYNDNFSQEYGTAIETTFKGRRALLMPPHASAGEHKSNFMIIDLPEQNGVIDVNYGTPFPEYTKPNIAHFLDSLKIVDHDWQIAEPLLVSQADVNTSQWKQFSRADVAFKYPISWTVTQEKDQDFGGLVNIILTKPEADIVQGYGTPPKVIIGNPEVFSTSGTICGNQGYNECRTVGTLDLMIQNNLHHLDMIDKNARSKSDRTLRNSFYVFSFTPEEIPAQPTISAIFATEEQGQEILNILSTITY